jgi:predicted dehydrogenase
MTKPKLRIGLTGTGFIGKAHATSDRRNIMANPEIDPVSITAPNALHKEMSLTAIAAGKHVYCEKPMAPPAADVLEMTLAAEAKGVNTQIRFNCLCNPMLVLARDMIACVELGDIRVHRRQLDRHGAQDAA